MHRMVNGKKVELTPEEAAELKKEWAANKRANTRHEKKYGYARKRKEAYPEIGDQLDAILKQMNYLQMAGIVDLIEPMDEVVSAWLKAKRDNPKPE